MSASSLSVLHLNQNITCFAWHSAHYLGQMDEQARGWMRINARYQSNAEVNFCVARANMMHRHYEPPKSLVWITRLRNPDQVKTIQEGRKVRGDCV